MAQFCFSNAATCASMTLSSAAEEPSCWCSSAWMARPPKGFLPLPLLLLLLAPPPLVDAAAGGDRGGSGDGGGDG